MERQARRERDSWDRHRRNREEEGNREDGNDQGKEEKGILINGERCVKQKPRDSHSLHREPPGWSPPSVAAESTHGDDREGIWQLRRFLANLGGRMHVVNNPVTSSQEPERRMKAEEPGLTHLLRLFPGLSFGNDSVPPPPPPPSSSHSRSSRGLNRGRTMQKRRYATNNTAEVMAEFKASPNPFLQAYQEKRSWRNERPSGVEYAERPAASTYTKASYPQSYPPHPTVETIPESDASNDYQQEYTTEDPTHGIYRVPSYRMNSPEDPYPPQNPSAPSANMRRRRRRGLGEELSTVPENWGTSADGHRRHP